MDSTQNVTNVIIETINTIFKNLFSSIIYYLRLHKTIFHDILKKKTGGSKNEKK